MQKAVAVMLCGIFAVVAGHVSSAAAKPNITVKTEYYSVRGDTGLKLMVQMNRRGPKHSWWARSIAQTQYTSSWGASWRWSKGACRAFKAPVGLAITYVYPNLEGNASAALRKRWKKFVSEVVVHEKAHGNLARQMVAAMEKEILATRMNTNDRNCRGMKRLLTKRVDKVIAAYEKKQRKFDEVEHRDGGNVDKMVARLIGEKPKKTVASRKKPKRKNEPRTYAVASEWR